ncbi:MAG: hypothetical protein J3K34DRAFT_524570 [Monoraphidium minutum]|nr:MAG: hypothetical protein J3K34DRAFT_524570 [Monoraphidium minutum]
MGFKDTKMFQSLAKRAYKDLDVDKTGRVDYKEVMIGLLKLYDKINEKLPMHISAPSRRDMMELCIRFDRDDDGTLDQAEFLDLARVMYGTRQRWRESLPWIIGSTLLLNLVLFPGAATLISRLIAEHTQKWAPPPAPLAGLLATVCGFLFKRRAAARKASV